MGPREHLEQCGTTHLDTEAPEVPFLAKMTKMPLVNPRLDRRSNKVKTLTKKKKKTFFIVLHQTRASWRILTTLIKFDPKSIRVGSKILILIWLSKQVGTNSIAKIIKFSFQRLFMGRNRDDAPIDAPLTFESHNFWSNRWIFKIHSFSETGSQNLFRGVKINPFLGLLRLAVLEGLPPQNACPGTPQTQKRTHFSEFLLFAWFTYTFLSLPNTKKHIKASWFFSLHQKHKVLFLYQSSFPWFHTLDLGFGGVDVAFLVIIHTPNVLNVFSSIYHVIFAWIIWFVAFFRMFLVLYVFLA